MGGVVGNAHSLVQVFDHSVGGAIDIDPIIEYFNDGDELDEKIDTVRTFNPFQLLTLISKFLEQSSHA